MAILITFAVMAVLCIYAGVGKLVPAVVRKKPRWDEIRRNR